MTTSQIAFSINASTLNNALSKVIGVVNKSATSEYLSCVKLKINDGQLSIEGTNMDCVIKSYDETVSNAINGSICVDAYSLFEIVKKLPKDKNIDFSIEEENIIKAAVVVNKTGMDGYIPAHILVYIAVHESMRGKGIGKEIMQQVMDKAKGGIALHVEPDNPAKKLYERLGFTNKYLEMRYQP